MKKLTFILCFLILGFCSYAQETYTIDGESLQLTTEVDGKLDLLWTIKDNEYRYFVRTADGNIQELKNTKGPDNKFQEEYKVLLSELTSDANVSLKRVNLTLFSLKELIDDYNQKSDATYTSQAERSQLDFRLGAFGGLTNSPFVSNPENHKSLYVGGELEVVEANQISRHAVFLQFKHVAETDDFQYSTTEIALGYRFRFINTRPFSLYGNVKVGTVNFTNATVALERNGETITESFNETAFDIPFIFGVGADIRLTENSFITLAYNELFALLLDNQGNFPVDFTAGIKFNL